MDEQKDEQGFQRLTDAMALRIAAQTLRALGPASQAAGVDPFQMMCALSAVGHLSLRMSVRSGIATQAHYDEVRERIEAQVRADEPKIAKACDDNPEAQRLLHGRTRNAEAEEN